VKFPQQLPDHRNNKLKVLVSVLLILTTGGILGYLLYRQRDLLLSYEWQFYPIPAVVSFLLFSLDLLLVAVVWGWIMNRLGRRLSLIQHIRTYCISNIAKRIPGTVWYIATRAQMYRQEGIDIRLTSIASGMELAVAVISGILVSILFAVQILRQYQVNLLVLGFVLLAGAFVMHPRVIGWIFRLLKVECGLFRYKDVLELVAAYMLAWILGGMVLFAIGRAIYPLPYSELDYVIGSWALVGVVSSALFFSPINLAVTEIGLSLLLTNIMPSPIAVILTVIARILLIVFEIVWVGFWLVLAAPKAEIIPPNNP